MSSVPAVSFAFALLGFMAVTAWRIREGRTPVTMKKILIPPAGMATGFSMFLLPRFQVRWTWGLVAFVAGAVLFAWPLVRASRLKRQGDVIMMERSAWFFWVVGALAIIRLLARNYLGRLVSPERSAGLLFILAFGMILRWRWNMLLEYRELIGVKNG